ncbi:hypothetical protein BJF79_03370 [Actinomadura sp. CNU-125]|uniref:DUF6879 family protein n=1 Tax=Actinomadura sp. CNU-125 TaxID=1904961 RepID=UPI00095D418B|nr:DUF6879 family protein [Actinomadura sp. CNU-125]OLT12953.1 hypothetical protein BJF79_03370 [Actinomadura sp. CNU-125]
MALLTPDEFATEFGKFTRSAFRLELFDHYVASNETEPFRLFLNGEIPSPEWRQPWQRLVRGKVAAGATMARVHVVTEPLTDYTLFELTCAYPASVAAGEDIRVLPRHRTRELDLPDTDFWLLDDRVAVMHYDRHGNWLSVDLHRAPDMALRYEQARNAAMAAASPLALYLNEIAHRTEEHQHGCHHRRAS